MKGMSICSEIEIGNQEKDLALEDLNWLDELRGKDLIKGEIIYFRQSRRRIGKQFFLHSAISRIRLYLLLLVEMISKGQSFGLEEHQRRWSQLCDISEETKEGKRMSEWHKKLSNKWFKTHTREPQTGLESYYF
jgi:hypothetical protein